MGYGNTGPPTHINPNPKGLHSKAQRGGDGLTHMLQPIGPCLPTDVGLTGSNDGRVVAVEAVVAHGGRGVLKAETCEQNLSADTNAQ